MRLKIRLLEPKNFIALVILLACVATGVSIIDVSVPKNDEMASIAPSDAPSLKADWDHILHGDETGGGHLYGTGIPCKSEFPADWNETKVKNTISRLAVNDNTNWRQESNGYFVSEQMVENIRVRVVLNSKRSEIVTSYPLNVERNPCSKPANDR